MGYLALVLTSILWGLVPLATKVALWEMPPFALSWLRFAFALAVVLPIFLLKKGRLPKRQDLFKVLFITSLAGFNVAFFVWGIQFTTTITSSLIYTSVPILTALGGFVFFKERISSLQVLGIIIAFLGVILLIFLPLIEKGSRWEIGSFSGNLFIALAAFSFTGYTLGSRHLSLRFNPLTITTISIFISLLIFTFLSPFELMKDSQWIASVTPKSILAVVYSGWGGTFLTFFLYQWVIKRTNAFVASLNLYLQPLVTGVAGVLILKEKITFIFLLGAVLIVLGVFLATSLNFLLIKNQHLKLSREKSEDY